MIFNARQVAVTIVGQFCIEARHVKNLLEVFSVDSTWRHIRCSLAAVIKNPIAKKSLGPQVSSLLRIIGSAFVWVAAYVFISTGNCATGSTSIGSPLTDANPLAMPSVGDYGLRVLSPTVLELTLINTKDEDPARVPNWDFVSDTFSLSLPATSSFTVTANGQTVGISSTGFKRRPIYAPVKQRDLRIGNHIYLKLASAIADGAVVEVKNPSGNVWTAPTQFVTTNDVLRFNPAIHVNEVGYMPNAPKKAMVGYYLGSFGEMDIPTANGFKIVNASSGAVVFSGALKQRKDVGYTYNAATPPAPYSPPYQKVYEADFTAFTTPGEYRLQVPGMGASFAFIINEGVAATFARTFALGLFHQRCGTDMDIPVTRFDHGFCHTNTVDVPTMAFNETQTMIGSKVSDLFDPKTGLRDPNVMPRHTAPPMTNSDASLYPFVRQGKIDVSKGHHDAGDYSKYTINSAGLIHHLVFAADSFPGAGDLDNLGIAESGDGKSDLLQEAKWEADYLAKMQDTDGGFYFLVYPKTREYEQDVTPDHGDPQVVWPKTTAVTAAATAALAEIASSPRFQQQFPTEAAAYMAKAELGWTFLMNAIAKYGKDGAYQKITHYGNEFMHDDELAWAASAMFVATRDPLYFAKLKEWLPDPNSTSVRRWGWWRMFEGYGCAIRTYAFAVRSHRISSNALMDATYLSQCEAEIVATADDITRFSNETAYGTSFPDPSKGNRDAGWYFSSERAFDITTGYQISAKPEYKEALFANINYEGGCNPVNVGYVTGLGWKRQRENVHQYSQNDPRVLPATGLPLGNVVAGCPYLYFYSQESKGPNELTELCFPADNAIDAPYAYYDRWIDTYNTMAEFVVVDEARSLASLSYWMAQSGIASQPWKPVAGQITGVPASLPVDSSMTVGLTAPGVDLTGAQIVWEVKYLEPAFGATRTFAPKFSGATWIEAEALLPDGRRIFARSNFTATTSLNTTPNSYESTPVTPGTNTVAIYHADNSLVDATGKQGPLALVGNAALDLSNVGWMASPSGGALRFQDLGDQAKVTIPAASMINANTVFVSVEAMIYINAFKGYNRGNAKILSLEQGWNCFVALTEDIYAGPIIKGGTTWAFGGETLKNALTPQTWYHLSLRVDKTGGYIAKLNGNVIAAQASSEFANWNATTPITLQLGDFDGWIDEVVVRSSTVTGGTVTNKPPTASLSAPSTTLTAPATVVLNATATDSDGSVAKVEFFNGATKIGEDTSSPYSFSWASVPAGTYSLTVRATDNQGATTTSSAVSVTVAAATGPTPPAATFVKTDTMTKGNWIGAYGSDGYTVVSHIESIPSYGGAVPSGKEDYLWTASTTDTRALQKVDSSDRIASVWYAPDSFNIDFNFTDANAHRVALYLMDWDGSGRAERLEVINPSNNTVLNTTDVSNFGQGKYVVFDLKGKTRIHVSRTAGPNVIVEGVFFDAAPKAKGASLKVKGASAQGLQIEVTGDTGLTYNIQSSSDMKTWNNVSQLNLTTSPMTFTDTTTTGNQGLRFYRIAP